jgi:hypothetical protein
MTLEELLLASGNLCEADKLKLIQNLAGNLGKSEEYLSNTPVKVQEKQSQENLIDDSLKNEMTETGNNFNSEEFKVQDFVVNTDRSNLYTDKEKPVQPSLVGFHRDSLITTVVLDCVWMILELGTAGLINFFVFIIFGLTSYIVFTKQRLLGDSQSTALAKSIFLGIVAGLPFSFTGLFIFGLFGVLNKVIPATENFAVKLPTSEIYNRGSFISEFTGIEELFAKSVAAIDPKKVSDKLAENIKFIEERGFISRESSELFNKARDIRNEIAHSSSKIVTSNDLQILRQFKIVAEKALEKH